MVPQKKRKNMPPNNKEDNGWSLSYYMILCSKVDEIISEAAFFSYFHEKVLTFFLKIIVLTT